MTFPNIFNGATRSPKRGDQQYCPVCERDIRIDGYIVADQGTTPELTIFCPKCGREIPVNPEGKNNQ